MQVARLGRRNVLFADDCQAAILSFDAAYNHLYVAVGAVRVRVGLRLTYQEPGLGVYTRATYLR